MPEDKNSIISAQASVGLGPQGEKFLSSIHRVLYGIVGPIQSVRVQKAKSEVELVRARTKLELDKIQDERNEITRRSIERFLSAEIRKQQNFEEILLKAVEFLPDDVQEIEIGEEWLADFFEFSSKKHDEFLKIALSRMLAQQACGISSISTKIFKKLELLDAFDLLNLVRLMDYEVTAFDPGGISCSFLMPLTNSLDGYRQMAGLIDELSFSGLVWKVSYPSEFGINASKVKFSNGDSYSIEKKVEDLIWFPGSDFEISYDAKKVVELIDKELLAKATNTENYESDFDEKNIFHCVRIFEEFASLSIKKEK